MAKIAYVVTAHNKITGRGEVRVYYTNGRDRCYKKETAPQTALDYCVMAKYHDKEETHDEITNTYWGGVTV